jgi:DNA repair protein RadC
MSITNWPESERPREKLLLRGPEALSDAELLAIFLRTGTRGKTALDLARELLNRFGSLSKLLNCSLTEFTATLGLGPAKYAQLQAAIELGQRYLKEPLSNADTLTNTNTVKQYLVSKLRNLDHEVFACLMLDTQNQLIRYQVLATGTHNEARVYPREVVKLALHYNAHAIILAHNHPSGNCQASEADLQLTRVLQDALGLVDVTVCDHIIVGCHRTFSFAEQEWL